MYISRASVLEKLLTAQTRLVLQGLTGMRGSLLIVLQQRSKHPREMVLTPKAGGRGGRLTLALARPCRIYPICTYIYIYICIYTYVPMYLSIDLSLCFSIYLPIFHFISICIYLCMYASVFTEVGYPSGEDP